MSPSSASLTLIRHSLSRRSAKAFGEGRRHVLDQYQRRREVGRQLGQHPLQGNRSTGGGTDRDQPVGLALRRRRGRRRGRRRAGTNTRARADAGGRRRRMAGRGGRRQRRQADRATIATGDGQDLLAEQLADLVRVARDVLEILRQVIDRSSVQCIQGHPRALVGQRGEHQDRGRATLHDVAYRGDAVHQRHLVIHGDHIGSQGQRLLDGLAAIGGGADHLDLSIGGENLRDTAAEEPRIVHHQDFDCHSYSSEGDAPAPPETHTRRQMRRA